jgi:hypothetical protein
MNQVRKGIDVTGDMDIVFYTSAPMRQDRREDREPTPATQPLPVHRTPSIDNWHQHPQANNVLRSLLPRFVQQHEARQEGGSGPHTRNTAPSGYLVGADEDEEQEEDKDEAEDEDDDQNITKFQTTAKVLFSLGWSGLKVLELGAGPRFESLIKLL